MDLHRHGVQGSTTALGSRRPRLGGSSSSWTGAVVDRGLPDSCSGRLPPFLASVDSCPVRSAAGWEGGAIITTRLGRCRSANLLDSPVGSLPLTVNWWESSERRRAVRSRLSDAGVDPSRVIMGPDAARSASLTSTAVFPVGNLAPEGSVIIPRSAPLSSTATSTAPRVR